MIRSMRPAVIAAIVAGLAAPRSARAAAEDVSGGVGPPALVEQEPIARFTIGMLVVHLARLGLAPSCGPTRNEPCVDTITSGPLFIGAGAGLRYRMARHLDAILALDAQLGTPDRTPTSTSTSAWRSSSSAAASRHGVAPRARGLSKRRKPPRSAHVSSPSPGETFS